MRVKRDAFTIIVASMVLPAMAVKYPAFGGLAVMLFGGARPLAVAHCSGSECSTFVRDGVTAAVSQWGGAVVA
jgi:hypothetical protein